MRRAFLVTFALGGVLAIAACTPSTGNPATGTPPTANPTATGPAATGPAATSPAASQAGTTIHVRDFTLDPGTVSIAGSTVTLAVTNDGPTVHNVKIRDASGAVLFGTQDLREGQSETISGDVAPGSYVLFCSLPGHESLGIKGTLTVTAP